MTRPINYMDLGEFREIGFVQESNRLFFHPRGVAMVWHPGWTREEFEKHMTEKGYQYGEDAMSNAWAGICALGMDKPHISGFWDDRDDPEGTVFVGDEDGTLPGWHERIEGVQRELLKHKEHRIRLFQDTDQEYPHEIQEYPLPSEHPSLHQEPEDDDRD